MSVQSAAEGVLRGAFAQERDSLSKRDPPAPQGERGGGGVDARQIVLAEGDDGGVTAAGEDDGARDEERCAVGTESDGVQASVAAFGLAKKRDGRGLGAELGAACAGSRDEGSRPRSGFSALSASEGRPVVDQHRAAGQIGEPEPGRAAADPSTSRSRRTASFAASLVSGKVPSPATRRAKLCTMLETPRIPANKR